ncbi:MAG: hypothetical protein R3B91_08050 [Planctomycetaceae bacterium]
MLTTTQELLGFSTFVKERVCVLDTEPNLDELFDHRRREHPSDELTAENIAAVKAALRDINSGDRGLLAGQLSVQLSDEYRLASE